AFYARLLDRARALPGAERAAYADFVPMGDRGDALRIAIPGRTADGDTVEVSYNRVSPGYFATVKHPLAAGREFTDRDRDGAAGRAWRSSTRRWRAGSGRAPTPSDSACASAAKRSIGKWSPSPVTRSSAAWARTRARISICRRCSAIARR